MDSWPLSVWSARVLLALILMSTAAFANPQRNLQEINREPNSQGYFTIYGESCKDRCRNDHTNYYWCYKKHESGWDYCSPNYDTTRYGKSCVSSCGQYGKYYYWCYESSGSWDYCSPH